MVERHICFPCPVTTIILPLPHSAFFPEDVCFQHLSALLVMSGDENYSQYNTEE